MPEEITRLLRHIFQHHINIHEVHEADNRELFADLFDLDDEELEAFDFLHDFICNHGLEQVIKPKRGE